MGKVTITDVTLRDGSHTINHTYTPEQMAKVAKSLDEAGVNIIEIGHGDGLGGSSIHVGRATATDEDYIKAVVPVVKNGKVAVLVVPGLATKNDLEKAANLGVKVARIGTHCSEADVTEQHIKLGKNLGLMTIGYLISCSMLPPQELSEQAKMMESFGADAIYLAESNGELLPDDVRARVSAVKKAVDIPIGFHAHNSLGCAIGNSLAALEVGATMLDGSLKGFGGGAGNTQTEVLVAALNKSGYNIDTNLLKIMDTAEDVFSPLFDKTPVIDNQSLLLGYTGVYGGYINPVNRESKKHALDPREMILELGKRKLVAGQEDVIIQVANEMANNK